VAVAAVVEIMEILKELVVVAADYYKDLLL
jgi:hypothetical protein